MKLCNVTNEVSLEDSQSKARGQAKGRAGAPSHSGDASGDEIETEGGARRPLETSTTNACYTLQESGTPCTWCDDCLEEVRAEVTNVGSQGGHRLDNIRNIVQQEGGATGDLDQGGHNQCERNNLMMGCLYLNDKYTMS